MELEIQPILDELFENQYKPQMSDAGLADHSICLFFDGIVMNLENTLSGLGAQITDLLDKTDTFSDHEITDVYIRGTIADWLSQLIALTNPDYVAIFSTVLAARDTKQFLAARMSGGLKTVDELPLREQQTFCNYTVQTRGSGLTLLHSEEALRDNDGIIYDFKIKRRELIENEQVPGSFIDLFNPVSPGRKQSLKLAPLDKHAQRIAGQILEKLPPRNIVCNTIH
ncbi:MAG: hypothetical protein HWE39_00680 [Oceanospirillaceae bacterium]|nr:hypothetical protein [Oceanospirillaceae bacterium]